MKEFRGAFVALVRREIVELSRDQRLVLGGIFCVALALGSAFSESHRLLSIRHEENLLSARWEEEVRAQLVRNEPLEVSSVRAASSLRPLAVGLDSALPQRFFSTKERLRFGESRSARATLESVVGTFDLSFVVAVALSLLTVVVSYDSISGERSNGTLALLLSYPVSRRQVLLAKFAALTSVVFAWLLGALGAGAACLKVMGFPVGDPARWLLFAALSGLYLSAWVCVGLAASCLAKQPGTSLLLGLVLWSLFVLVAPRVLPALSARTEVAERLVQLSVFEEESLSGLRRHYQEAVTKLFGEYARAGLNDPAAKSTFKVAQGEAQEALNRERRELSARVWEEQARIDRSQARRALMFLTLSPTALFQAAAAEIAQSGNAQRELFYSAAREYYDRIGLRLAESQRFYLSMTGDSGLALSTSEEYNHLLVQFEMPWCRLRTTMQDCLFPATAIAVFGLIWIFLGIGAFWSLDPRA
ncbi:MAG: ABC transporter permease [Thermoanaerobaculia bacterium]